MTAMETASLIKKMVEEDGVIRCEKLGLVFNRVRGNEDLLRNASVELGIDLVGLIPFDENIATCDLVGKPITDLPADSPGLAAYRSIQLVLTLGTVRVAGVASSSTSFGPSRRTCARCGPGNMRNEAMAWCEVS